jgi:hypothetical protein
MPIVIEEVSAEVMSEPRHEARGSSDRESGAPKPDVEDRVRAVLARVRRRAERLSDR